MIWGIVSSSGWMRLCSVGPGKRWEMGSLEATGTGEIQRALWDFLRLSFQPRANKEMSTAVWLLESYLTSLCFKSPFGKMGEITAPQF